MVVVYFLLGDSVKVGGVLPQESNDGDKSFPYREMMDLIDGDGLRQHIPLSNIYGTFEKALRALRHSTYHEWIALKEQVEIKAERLAAIDQLLDDTEEPAVEPENADDKDQ